MNRIFRVGDFDNTPSTYSTATSQPEDTLTYDKLWQNYRELIARNGPFKKFPADELWTKSLPPLLKAVGAEEINSDPKALFGSLAGVPVSIEPLLPPGKLFGMKRATRFWELPKVVFIIDIGE